MLSIRSPFRSKLDPARIIVHKYETKTLDHGDIEGIYDPIDGMLADFHMLYPAIHSRKRRVPSNRPGKPG